MVKLFFQRRKIQSLSFNLFTEINDTVSTQNESTAEALLFKLKVKSNDGRTVGFMRLGWQTNSDGFCVVLIQAAV